MVCGPLRSHSKHINRYMVYIRGVKLFFTGDHISLMVTFIGPNVILGVYICNYSLTRVNEFGAASG